MTAILRASQGDPMIRRIALPSGVDLEVALLGNPEAPPIILLHGFPESYRTWRHQMLSLAIRYFVIAPNQRGYGASSRPEACDAYTPQKLICDVIALADALGLETFALVGHDWGGAIAWSAALRYPRRVRRLAIVNAPHPLLLQRAVIESPEQRRASQFIRTFRDTALDRDLTEDELTRFFEDLFIRHLGARVSLDERERYFEQWRLPGALRAMLHWYRASNLTVPAMDETVERPEWIDGPFPLVSQPTLAIWGMRDAGLRPMLLDGLDQLCAQLTIVQLPGAGHFPQWETPAEVTRALGGWLAANPSRPMRW